MRSSSVTVWSSLSSTSTIFSSSPFSKRGRKGAHIPAYVFAVFFFFFFSVSPRTSLCMHASAVLRKMRAFSFCFVHFSSCSSTRCLSRFVRSSISARSFMPSPTDATRCTLFVSSFSSSFVHFSSSSRHFSASHSHSSSSRFDRSTARAISRDSRSKRARFFA